MKAAAETIRRQLAEYGGEWHESTRARCISWESPRREREVVLWDSTPQVSVSMDSDLLEMCRPADPGTVCRVMRSMDAAAAAFRRALREEE